MGHQIRIIRASYHRGESMKKRIETEDLRLNPEARLCPLCDAVSIRKIPAPTWEDMGVRVLDNCAEEHIM